MTFTVVVACLAHFAACPLKGEYRQTITAPTEKACIETARTTIASFGFPATSFRIRCQK